MREKTITIGGNQWRLSALEVSAIFELHAEFKKTPCPVQELLDTAKLLPEAAGKEFVNRHIDEAFSRKRDRNSIESAEFNQWMKRDGVVKFVAKMFRKNHPNLSDQEAFNLACEGVIEHGQSVFEDLFPSKS